jgi:hypothetical protein
MFGCEIYIKDVYGSLIIDRYSVGVEGTVYNTESLPDMR